MTATLTRQIRVVTNRETGADDALTVSSVRELAWAMNNYKSLVSGIPLITSASPIDIAGGSYASGWQTWSATTTEDLFHRFAPRVMPLGYDVIHFQIAGVLEAGSTGTVTFKLYASQGPYNGSLTAFDTSLLGGAWSVSTGIAISSTTHQSPAAVTNLVPVRSTAGTIYLTMTATKTVAGDECMLSAINATAKVAV